MSDNEGVLLEDIDHKLQTILEGVAPLATVPNDLAELKDDVREVRSGIEIIKAAIRDQSKQQDHLPDRF